MAPDGGGVWGWLLRLAGGDRERAGELVADLREERDRHVRPARGRVRAFLWYHGQALRAVPWMMARRAGAADRVATELRHAARRLVRAPATTGVTLAVLGLAVGANAALYPVLRAVVLEPLPYADPGALFHATARNDDRGIEGFSFTVAEVRRMAGRGGPIAGVAGDFPVSLTWRRADGEGRRVAGRRVTGGFFRLFGAEPARGRAFTEDEIRGGDRPLAVVSHGFWNDALGAEPDIVGRSVELDGTAFEIVGVMGPGWRHPLDPGADVYLPYTLGTEGWIGRWLDVYVRAEAGAGPDAVRGELDRVMRAVARDGNPRSEGWRSEVESLGRFAVGDARTALVVLAGAVLLLLLVATVDVASLGLARATARAPEVALRSALGATRGRLLREALAEQGLLATLGAALGYAAAAVALPVLVRLAPAGTPRLDEVGMDGGVMVFTLLITGAAALAAGLVPALAASRRGPADAVRGAGRGGVAPRTRRLLGLLVVAQVAFTVTLAAGAGLLLRTRGELRSVELGFRPEGAEAYRLAIPAARYASAPEVAAFVRRHVEALAARADVASAGAAADLPLGGTGALAGVWSEAMIRAGVVESVPVLQRRAGPGFFEAAGIEVLDGRVFADADGGDGPPVAVLSRSLARALFGEASPVGQAVSFRAAPGDDDWMTILGVVEDVRYEGLEGPPRPQLYESLARAPVRDVAVVVRAARPGPLGAPALRAALAELDPAVPLHGYTPLPAMVDRALADRTFALLLLGLFAAVALVLTAAGLFGVTAFVVARRARETGLRLALGARGGQIEGAVVGRGILLALAGVVPGALGAWLVERGLGALVYGAGAADPALWAAVTAGAVGVAAAASWLPARRAARVDPALTLRRD